MNPLIDALVSAMAPAAGAQPAQPSPEEIQARLNRATQGRVDRHNQNLPPEVRGSQMNQDLDHYLVGNEMAGPQYPMWQRLGAIVPMVANEAVRPFQTNPTLVSALNRVFGTKDQPVWLNEGAGAGGGATEGGQGVSGAIRNLQMLYRGATGGALPGQ